MNEKITDHHLARKAILYVRQSSQQQVVRNEESRRLQYAMATRLEELGWSDIEIVDDDLGKSAAGTTGRSGFERMVADVCLGQVGVVAAREVSRFARNSRDWQQLVEVCRMVDTVLVDHESVYDPRRGNDRLLLGLKGSLNEYELDILRLRSLEARYEKARRGELIAAVPIGYLKSGDGQIVKDPDRRVVEALTLLFDKFGELGSARQVLLWFLSEGLELPMRRHSVTGWETGWRRPTLSCAAVFGTETFPTHGLTRLRKGEAKLSWTRLVPCRWQRTIVGSHASFGPVAVPRVRPRACYGQPDGPGRSVPAVPRRCARADVDHAAPRDRSDFSGRRCHPESDQVSRHDRGRGLFLVPLANSCASRRHSSAEAVLAVGDRALLRELLDWSELAEGGSDTWRCASLAHDAPRVDAGAWCARLRTSDRRRPRFRADLCGVRGDGGSSACFGYRHPGRDERNAWAATGSLRCFT